MVYFGVQHRADRLIAAGTAAVLEENCADCADATEEGLREGLAAIERGIELGADEDAEALRALRSGYNTLMSQYIEHDAPEFETVRTRLDVVSERILAIEPMDAEALYEHAASLESADMQLEMFRRVTETDPEFAPAQYALGTMLYDRGEKDEAVDRLKAAVRHADPLRAFSYYVQLLRVLKAEGRLDEGQEFAVRFENEALPAELTQQD
jgi:tetratricopeptide (TPR) repeat protein